MTCRELIDFLLDYDSGDLAAAVRNELERHLSDCPPCLAYLETYRRAVALVRHAFAELEESVGSVPEELVRAILAARGRGR